jgi:signal transduction histidine kinase
LSERLGFRLRRLSLIGKFNLISLMILLVGSAAVGWWISDQIESRVLLRVGHATSMFTGSVVAPVVDELVHTDLGADRAGLDDVLNLAVLGESIVSFKIWDDNGRVIHSSNDSEIGLMFEIDAGLEKAWNGMVSAEISQLDQPEHSEQRKSAERLLEIYTPVRQPGTGTIIAVLEFYQSVSEFDREIRSARIQTWIIVSALVTAIYLSLVMLVRGGSRTIVHQRDRLETQVLEFQRLLTRNAELDKRLRTAAARTTALNEEHLRRIAADLHDGPAQDIGYALLKLDDSTTDDYESSQAILNRALDDIRSISAGLRSPELEALSLEETVRRAVRGHQQRSAQTIAVTCTDLPESISLAMKITVFRIIQESLNNARRHSADESPTVAVTQSDGFVRVTIEDTGPGFTQVGTDDAAHFGIAFMRERVELLGGTFSIASSLAAGTVVTAAIPLHSSGETISG